MTMRFANPSANHVKGGKMSDDATFVLGFG
jgi:hypothetical protein